jgi:glycosyltransferase involved in cell wall biosynthesis
VVEPDNPDALRDAIWAMTRLRSEERRRMGNLGRAWAMTNATAEVCLPRLIGIMESVAQ